MKNSVIKMEGGNKTKVEKSVQITGVIVLGVIILALIGFAMWGSPGGSLNKPITVQGLANVKASPDIIGVYFNVETSGATSEEATTANSEIIDNLITNLVKLGFERKQIQTTNFNVYPDIQWINGRQVDKGYKATHSVRVELNSSETSKIGQVIDAGVEAGAGVSYINFELSTAKQSEYKAEAIKLAAQDARIKAQALAEGFGKKVGALVSTSVDNYNYNPWNVYSGSGMASDSMMAKEAATNIQPSEQEISASVTASFKLK